MAVSRNFVDPRTLQAARRVVRKKRLKETVARRRQLEANRQAGQNFVTRMRKNAASMSR